MPSIPIKAFNTHLKPSTYTYSPLHSSLALQTQPKLFTPIPGPTYPSLAPTLFLGSLHPPYANQISSRTPITSKLTHSPPSEVLHSHQSLQYTPQALHTHLRLFIPIPGSPYPPKALHANLRPITLISGPPHPPKALHAHLRHSNVPLISP